MYKLTNCGQIFAVKVKESTYMGVTEVSIIVAFL